MWSPATCRCRCSWGQPQAAESFERAVLAHAANPAVNSVTITSSFQRQASGRHFGEFEFGNGHDAEFGERLLIGSALGCHIAAVHSYPQTRPNAA